MHLDDELVQRTLDGERGGTAKEAADRHLAGCAECRLRLEEAGREQGWLSDLLRRIDTVAPSVDPESLARRARAGTLGVWARRAAGIVLVAAAAGVAYTAPGSPVPGWIDRLAGRAVRPAPALPPGAVLSPPATSGIAVAPGERLTIRFAEPQAAGVATAWVTDGPNVVARAIDGTATFATDVDRLTIVNRGSNADYEIELPRGAPWVEIEVGGRRLLLLQGSRVVTDAPADARGRYVLSLAAGR